MSPPTIVVITAWRFQMKQIKTTIQKKKYVLSLYKWKRNFATTETFIIYDDKIGYKEYFKVHEGAYDKIFSKELTEEKLKKQMELYGYNKNQEYYFYGSLKDALIYHGVFDMIVTIKEASSYYSGLNYILNPRKKKKKNPASHNKNGKRYYCNCMRCTGHTYEMNQKIHNKDEQKLNKDK